MAVIGSILNTLLLAFATRNDNSFNTTPTVKKMADNGIINGCQDDVLSKLRSLGMGKKELPHHKELRRASILVPLFERNNVNVESSQTSCESNIHVLFTQRPKTMRSHGGEVCFPGGKQDDEDEGDDVRTAMREAHEEVGLHPKFIDGIARMETLESKHSLCVTPIIALVQPSSVAEPSQLQLNADEVEAAFAVPLHYFADPDNCHAIEKVKWSGNDFLLRTYLYDDPESGRQFRIWGLTAHVAHLVATKAFCKK
mmetsp:Transcript_21581/g.46947  ORF Transcript_21581/g.46947 Transcript_21581/m.46947 type:complete len:255 (+) Transcript_21581:91-855(+)